MRAAEWPRLDASAPAERSRPHLAICWGGGSDAR